MQNDCLICKRINLIKQKNNPFFVAEMKTGFVVLGDNQYYRGYTIFLCKIHANELHELNQGFKKDFLNEMSIVAEAVYRAFKPKKLNYELLGNKDSHLHWHIFPRYLNDDNSTMPVWVNKKAMDYNSKSRINKNGLSLLKNRLFSVLKNKT